MKIVFDITGLPQTGGGSVRPYSTPPDAPLPVDGYVDEIVICTPRETLRIEGTLASMYYMAENLMSLLEGLASDQVNRGKLDPAWSTKGRAAMLTREDVLEGVSR